MVTVETQTEPCEELREESSKDESTMNIKGEKDIAELIKIMGKHVSVDRYNKATFNIEHIATKLSQLTGISIRNDWVIQSFK